MSRGLFDFYLKHTATDHDKETHPEMGVNCLLKGQCHES